MLTRSLGAILLVLMMVLPALAQQEMRSSTKGASTPLPITGSAIDADHNALDVNCLSGCTGGAGGGGTSATDDAAFTPGTDAVTPAGFLFDDVAPDSVNEGDIGVGRMSANRNQYSTIRDAAGNERGLNIDANGELGVSAIRSALPSGTNAIGKLSANSGVDIGDVDVTSVVPGTTATSLGKAEDAAHASGDTGVMSLCVRRDTAATSATTDGDYSPCATDANGKLWTNADTELPAAATLADATSNPTVPGVASFNMCFNGTTWDRCVKAVDPCQVNTKSYANINGTAGATIITGTASKKIYVCSLVLVTATAQNINLVSGTGTVCATGTTAMLGLSGGTTAATGWNLAANGGLTLGSGGFSLGQTQNNADNLCMLVSGSGQVTGGLSYVVQ